MPYPQQYTREQRQQAYEMYWEGRDKKNTRAGGKFTLKQISKITGVSVTIAHRIAHGEA